MDPSLNRFPSCSTLVVRLPDCLPLTPSRNYLTSPRLTAAHVYRRRRNYCASSYSLLMSRILNSLQPGDVVAVSHGAYGRREGLVVGAHIDYAVRFPPLFAFTCSDVAAIHRVVRSSKCSWNMARCITRGTSCLISPPIYLTSSVFSSDGLTLAPRYPSVTRVRRTVSYARPSMGKQRTIERRIYW